MVDLRSRGHVKEAGQESHRDRAVCSLGVLLAFRRLRNHDVVPHRVSFLADQFARLDLLPFGTDPHDGHVGVAKVPKPVRVPREPEPVPQTTKPSCVSR